MWCLTDMAASRPFAAGEIIKRERERHHRSVTEMWKEMRKIHSKNSPVLEGEQVWCQWNPV